MYLIALLTYLFFNQPEVYKVDSRLEQYVCEYIEILETAGIEIPDQRRFMVKVHKKSLPRGAAGAAWGMFKPQMVMIAVDPAALNLDHNQLRWLMFHEMTHDLWDIRHESDLFLMRPVMPEYVTSYDVKFGMQELIMHLKDL